jgi:hypothetical protein
MSGQREQEPSAWVSCPECGDKIWLYRISDETFTNRDSHTCLEPKVGTVMAESITVRPVYLDA